MPCKGKYEQIPYKEKSIIRGNPLYSEIQCVHARAGACVHCVRARERCAPLTLDFWKAPHGPGGPTPENYNTFVCVFCE